MDAHPLFRRERDDDVLGDGWTWSQRRVKQVNYENNYTMRVSNRKQLLFGKGGVWLIMSDEDAETTSWPVIKMVMLTHFPEAIRDVEERYKISKGEV